MIRFKQIKENHRMTNYKLNVEDRPNNNYIVIGSLASGDPIMCEKDSERISIYNHEAAVIEDDETFEDFYEFLRALYDLLGIGG